MQSQLQKFKISNWTRVHAIDGANDSSIKYQNDFTTLSSSEIGCTLSHLKAIQLAYSSDHEYALIVEDDIDLHLMPFWDESLSSCLNRLNSLCLCYQEPWHILQLYSNFNYAAYPFPNVFIRSPNVWSMAAYVINRSGMKQILDRCFVNGEFILSSKLSAQGIADYYIYDLAGFNKRYLTSRPLLVPNNLNLPSVIHDEHTPMHLRWVDAALNLYMDKLSPKS